MTQENSQPDQRARADRAGSSKVHDPNLAEAAILRNEQHLLLSREPHLWRKALMATDLPASSFRVALAIVDTFVNRKTGACYPSLETIATTCGLSVSGAKKGLSALREAGLVHTEKRRFNGSNSILLCLGQSNRMDLNGSVRTGDEQTETGPSIVPIQVSREYPNGSHISTRLGPITLEDNLSTEPSNLTSEDRVIPCGPPSAVVASAPPVDIPASPPCLPRTALVVGDGQPSDFHLEKEEETFIPCPQDLAEQRLIIEQITGEKGRGRDHVNLQLLDLLKANRLSLEVARKTIEQHRQRQEETHAA